MKEKYGGIENFVKEGTPPKEKNEKVESKERSSSSKILDKTDGMVKTKEIKKKKNRNRKVGINKHNNYASDVYAPRKVCAKCGSTNHLSIDCKTVSAPISNSSPSQLLMPNLAPPNLAALSAQFSAMPFMNPFPAYNMNFFMPWNMNMNPDNNPYASQFINAIKSELSKIEPVNVPLTKSQTPKVENEPCSSKSVVANSSTKSKVRTNKARPKTAWVPKIT